MRTPACLILILLNGLLSAADADGTLVLATQLTPPFVTVDGDGRPHGLSIDLWESLVADPRFGGMPRYRWVVTDLADCVEGVADHRYDAAVAALTTRAERSAQVDFTHPFHVSGLAIAVKTQEGTSLRALTRGMLSPAFLAALSALLILLAVPGTLVWLAERRRNPQFPGDPIPGIGAGLWWSAVTMSTVGYGDKAPVSAIGRFVAIAWMFASLVLISSVTASLTSSMTTTAQDATVIGPKDLPKRKVATVTHATAEGWLTRQGGTPVTFATLDEALIALEKSEVEAVVHDALILEHRSARRRGLTVVPGVFQRQDYAILLPIGSPLRMPLNRAIHHHLDENLIIPLVERYLH